MTIKQIVIYLLIFILLALLILLITAQTVSAPGYSQFINSPQIDIDGYVIKLLPSGPAATTTIIFGGDVMLSRTVQQKMAQYNNWSWPLENIANLTAAADLAVVNLESPFTKNTSYFVKDDSTSFNADPRSIATLKSAGIDIVSLANNHIMDRGIKGLKDTREILTANQIDFVGAGLNELQARKPVIKEINNIKFAFLAYAYPQYSSVNSNTPGSADMNIEKMKTNISQLKDQVDIVIVLMHAGIEYTNKPNRQQIEFAHAAVEAGADLIIGHHPHWVQSIEIYKNRPIIYSLGNLVFDQMWSKQTQIGALAKINWTNKIMKNVEIITIHIKDYGRAEISTNAIEINNVLKVMGLKFYQIK